MKLAALFLITSAALAGGSSPPKVDTPSHRKPSSSAKVLKLGNDTSLRKESDLRDLAKKLSGSTVSCSSSRCTWDLKGGILDGSKQKGDGGQDESQEPLIRVRMKLIIKNGFVRNNKDAMGFYEPDSGVERVTWLNVGEDAVSTSKGAYGFLVKDCEFINRREGDKSIQLNEAKDARVEGNLVFSGVTCMRIGDSGTTSVSETATVKNNRFLGCDTAIHASKITVDESGNSFEKVNTPWKSANGAVRK